MPRKLRVKTVDPTRMNTTKHDSFVVESIAWRSSFHEKRPRDTAMANAPTAPMAPPSVGVATPMKMVPNTRKMRKSGGIITNVTRSAISESSLRRNARLTRAMIQAVTPHTSSTMTTRSSTGTASCVRK